MSAPAQTAGIPPEWETRKMLTELAGQVQRFTPILQQLKPQEWVAAGAPETYSVQLKSTIAEIDYLVRTSQALAQQPERLTLALESYFRLQSIETSLDSLSQGVRKYQNPAIGDLLRGLLNETLASRDRLRQYLVQLAGEKEQEFKIADQEAQRCRGMISRMPPPKPQSKKSEAKKTESK